jgi:lysine 2,3-aminomutase
MISQMPDRVVLRNYEGVITTYTEPNHEDEVACTCDYCTGKKSYKYEGVAALLEGDRLSLEPEGLLRHTRNKK